MKNETDRLESKLFFLQNPPSVCYLCSASSGGSSNIEMRDEKLCIYLFCNVVSFACIERHIRDWEGAREIHRTFSKHTHFLSLIEGYFGLQRRVCLSKCDASSKQNDQQTVNTNVSLRQLILIYLLIRTKRRRRRRRMNLPKFINLCGRRDCRLNPMIASIYTKKN